LSCNSLSALVWGWTSPIRVYLKFKNFVHNLTALAGQDQQQIPRTSPMQNVNYNNCPSAATTNKQAELHAKLFCGWTRAIELKQI